MLIELKIFLQCKIIELIIVSFELNTLNENEIIFAKIIDIFLLEKNNTTFDKITYIILLIKMK